MNSRRFTVVVVFIGLMLAGATGARANDKIVSSVSPVSGPTPVIMNNGVSNGTIQLWYTYTGNSYPCGTFATFDLNMVDQAGTGTAPTYPVTLDLTQSGVGTPVQFPSLPGPFSVTGVGWTTAAGTSLVTVSIDCSQLPPPTDGEDIDGNLNVGTVPAGAHLDTISTIQVHIRLVFPTQCLKLYSFETGEDSSTILSSIQVNANRTGDVKSTSPGQLSVDGLVANTCPTSESFDMLIGLDPDWQTNPISNPGNATFIYTTSGDVDPSTFNLTAFGTGTGEHETLCLTNVTLAGNDSFLTTVHSGIIDGLTLTTLPGDGDFDFSAALYPANSGCSGSPIGSSIVGPTNPATSTLTITTN